ncbi:hypothetical protein [Paenibacillus sp.]|uniref:phage tail fiber protein n=1 Tax=Paenibacillus sp. TaxID=58172 RepID=UPI002826131A|nr:hypothetical protein [Paenibacillus sp.]MDR0269645.1 hypothetical protein [Paenibacillus sp.]
MAVQISNWLSAQLLNAALCKKPFTPPETVYLALYTSDPTPADTGQEVTGGGYARQPIPFALASLENGKTTNKNSTDIEFPTVTEEWGLITHVALRTAATGGNLMWSKALGDNARTVRVGDKPKFYKDSVLVRVNQ